jgi:hypothetical protein
MHMGYWWGGVLSVRGHFEDRGVEGNIILQCILLK